MLITISTKDLELTYSASTGREAVQMFFDDIKTDKIALSDLGILGSWSDGHETYPFRLAPALFKCGLLSRKELLALFQRAELEFDHADIEAMTNSDSWMVREGVNCERS
jgi:hypothetical protein